MSLAYKAVVLDVVDARSSVILVVNSKEVFTSLPPQRHFILSMKINLFLKGNRLSKSPRRRDREINHVLYNIGQVKSWVDDTFGVHEWSAVL